MEAKKKKMLTRAYCAFLCAVLFGSVIRSEADINAVYGSEDEISIFDSKVSNIMSYIERSESNAPVQGDASTEIVKYTVKETEGRIGIFSSDGSLIMLLPVIVEFLPETDRRLLSDGIDLYDDASLASLIEDYID